jgi:hypothetical protein
MAKITTKRDKEDVGMSFSSAAEFFRRTGQKIVPRVGSTDGKNLNRLSQPGGRVEFIGNPSPAIEKDDDLSTDTPLSQIYFDGKNFQPVQRGGSGIKFGRAPPTCFWIGNLQTNWDGEDETS